MNTFSHLHRGEGLLTWLKPRHENNWGCYCTVALDFAFFHKKEFCTFPCYPTPPYTIECDNRNVGRKVIWKSALLSQLWGPFSKEYIKTSISHTNFTNPIAWQWKAHKNRAGTGILWNGLDRWSKPDIPRPARACNRQKMLSFQGGFWKMWHKKHPMHRVKR